MSTGVEEIVSDKTHEEGSDPLLNLENSIYHIVSTLNPQNPDNLGTWNNAWQKLTNDYRDVEVRHAHYESAPPELRQITFGQRLPEIQHAITHGMSLLTSQEDLRNWIYEEIVGNPKQQSTQDLQIGTLILAAIIANRTINLDGKRFSKDREARELKQIHDGLGIEHASIGPIPALGDHGIITALIARDFPVNSQSGEIPPLLKPIPHVKRGLNNS